MGYKKIAVGIILLLWCLAPGAVFAQCYSALCNMMPFDIYTEVCCNGVVCPAGQTCNAGVCVSGGGCVNDGDCLSDTSRPICNTAGTCVQCNLDSICVANASGNQKAYCDMNTYTCSMCGECEMPDGVGGCLSMGDGLSCTNGTCSAGVCVSGGACPECYEVDAMGNCIVPQTGPSCSSSGTCSAGLCIFQCPGSSANYDPATQGCCAGTPYDTASQKCCTNVTVIDKNGCCDDFDCTNPLASKCFGQQCVQCIDAMQCDDGNMTTADNCVNQQCDHLQCDIECQIGSTGGCMPVGDGAGCNGSGGACMGGVCQSTDCSSQCSGPAMYSCVTNPPGDGICWPDCAQLPNCAVCGGADPCVHMPGGPMMF